MICRYRRWWYGALVVGLMPCLAAIGRQELQTAKRPQKKMVVLVVIDQLRYEYLERFRPAFQGGLKTLLDQGLIFSNAHHDHANTSTSPGHASISTGRHPSHSGIIANSWFDRSTEKNTYSLQDADSPVLPFAEGASEKSSSSSGRSPRNLLVDGLADWIKKNDSEAKAFAMGGKDRASILTGGQNPDGVFWYEQKSGAFVTSEYYMGKYPSWIKDFNNRKIVDSFFGKTWDRFPAMPQNNGALGIELLDEGVYKSQLPRSIGGPTIGPDASFYKAFYSTPFIDGYVLELAKALVEGESLGTDDSIDFLGICLSAIDSVGHEFGPNSPEIIDAFLRLDASLGEFFGFLDQKIGLRNVAMVLSADHGVMPVPEFLQAKGRVGKRFKTDDVVCIQRVKGDLDQQFGQDEWFLEGLYLNYEALGRRNLRRQEVEEAAAASLEKCDSVKKVWTRTELESKSADNDIYRRRFDNSFHPDRSADLFLQLKEYHQAKRDHGTTHGSPYDYDTHVPVILLIDGVAAGMIDNEIATVDLAPTLAALLGIPYPDDVDGKDRTALLEKTQ